MFSQLEMLLIIVEEDPKPQFLLNSRVVDIFRPCPANPGENSFILFKSFVSEYIFSVFVLLELINLKLKSNLQSIHFLLLQV